MPSSGKHDHQKTARRAKFEPWKLDPNDRRTLAQRIEAQEAKLRDAGYKGCASIDPRKP